MEPVGVKEEYRVLLGIAFLVVIFLEFWYVLPKRIGLTSHFNWVATSNLGKKLRLFYSEHGLNLGKDHEGVDSSSILVVRLIAKRLSALGATTSCMG